MDENEKESGEEGQQEDKDHESAHQDEETTPDEDQLSEDQCDEAIAELLATIAALESRVNELESQLAGIREHRSEHEREYEHTARRVEPGPADGDVSPDERHWYFRKLGQR